jgi:hypothetical protein
LLAHEAEHNRIAGDAIRTFLDHHKAELAQLLRQLKAQPARDEEAAKKAMKLGLMSAAVCLTETFHATEIGRMRDQADSPARLSTLGDSCDGRIVELERTDAAADRQHGRD